MATGGCLCGGVRYTITGPLRPVCLCHCKQCRKTSGHYVAATQAAMSDLEIHDTGSLKWYRSSKTAMRGFCTECGGNLFWQPVKSEHMSIFAGTLDEPTGLETTGQIFTKDKGDYYPLPDLPILSLEDI